MELLLYSVRITCHFTALSFEAEKPAMNAKTHNKNTIRTSFIKLPYFNFVIGLNKKESINITIPTCKPETSKGLNV